MASQRQRFYEGYYVFNTALLLLYIPLRTYFRNLTPDGSDYSTLHSPHELATWEKQAMTSYVIILLWQFMRRRSWDHFAQSVFFYGKVITALTTYLVDARLLVWYVLLCWVAIVVCPQPLFQLHGNSDDDRVVVGLDPVHLKENVLQSTDTNWLVFYYSEQHKESAAMAPAFYEVAERYVTPKLRFGCMEATLWPMFSKDTLKLTTNPWSAHVPTVVLYSKGKEVGRLPRPEDIDDFGFKRNYYTKTDVIKKLNLDKYRS